MNIQDIKTFGDLKKADYEHKTIKEELRRNLLQKLMKQQPVFDGIHGYEFTVIPEVESAILTKHNINLLG
jgi:magnesium chelatase subunit I